MAGIKALIALAFAGSLGITLLVLGCALKEFDSVWWPFFVVVFYILSPIPLLIARRYTDDMSASNAVQEIAFFVTTFLILSSFALPIVLARAPPSAPTIKWGACGLTISANIVVFLTILGFFLAFDNDDVDYSMW